jgi:outer membrane receptor for ferrienterochelin and colicin
MGAASDVNGDYIIVNVPAGTYTLKATYVGYSPVQVSNIRVNNDLTTAVDFALPAESVTLNAVEIIAERPLVNKSATNAVRISTSDDIAAVPVRGINNILALTPGVVLQDNTVFIRGGRIDEVGYYLEGVSITNPMVGGRAVTLVQDAVEEIQVQAGGYNAEFGGANAGIVQQQLRSGTSTWKGSVQYITDNMAFASKKQAFSGSKRLGAYWFGYNEFTGSLSGPVFTDRVKLFSLFNYNYQRDQNPQPYPGIALGPIVGQTGDTVNLSYPAGPLLKNPREDYTYTGTLTFDFAPVTARLAGTFTTSKQNNQYNSHRNAGAVSNILDIARIEEISQTNGAGSLKVTHMLSPSTYYELAAGYFAQTQRNYDPVLGDNFLGYGDSVANAQAGVVWQRTANDITSGQIGRYLRPTRKSLYDFTFNAPGDLLAGYQRFKRESLSGSLALVTQIGSEHSIKVGAEFQRHAIRGYAWNNDNVFALAGLLANNAALPAGDPNKVTPEQVLINLGVNNFGYDVWGAPTSGSGYQGARHPVFAAAYVQDKLEFKDLVVNIGLRYDYINTDNYTFVDLTRPELSIDPYSGVVDESGLKKVPGFQSLSPRVGLSFPVSDRTVFHTQYGQFVQQSRLRDMYQGLFTTSVQVRGGSFISIPVGFDVRPSRTTQYEIGFTQQLGDFGSFDITGYYKDIKDQVVYEQMDTQPTSPIGSYYIFANGDFATTKGVEVTFAMRRQKRLQANASLSFQDARGTGSYPNSNRGIVGAPLDGSTIFKPQYVSLLEYNNAIRGTLNVDYRFDKDDGGPILEQLGVSALMTFNSGHPYTRGTGAADLEGDARNRQPVEALNASTTPWVFQVDLRVDKTVRLLDAMNLNIALYVINLFDARNIQNVFLRTGSTDDDGVLSNPALGQPLMRTYGPRYADVYRAVNIDYYERYQNAIGLNTVPYFYGPPRQVRLGVRLDY